MFIFLFFHKLLQNLLDLGQVEDVDWVSYIEQHRLDLVTVVAYLFFAFCHYTLVLVSLFFDIDGKDTLFVD